MPGRVFTDTTGTPTSADGVITIRNGTTVNYNRAGDDGPGGRGGGRHAEYHQHGAPWPTGAGTDFDISGLMTVTSLA